LWHSCDSSLQEQEEEEEF